MRKQEQPEVVVIAGAPDWLVTFGDMMSLLLTFFILLFSVSEVKNPNRIYEIVQQFKGKVPVKSFTYGHLLPHNIPGPTGMVEDSRTEPREMGEKGDRETPLPDAEGESQELLTIWEREGLQRVASARFKHGQAHLLEGERRALVRGLLPEVTAREFPIVLMGHAAAGEAADEEALHLLAYRRALSVHVFLISSGIAESRIEMQSAGAIYNGSAGTKVDEEKLRRVDILLRVGVLGAPPRR